MIAKHTYKGKVYEIRQINNDVSGLIVHPISDKEYKDQKLYTPDAKQKLNFLLTMQQN